MERHPMGLFRTTLILGIGYALGRPAVRQELVAAVERIRALAQHPDMVELRDRKWTHLADTLDRPHHLRPEAMPGHPSSGLRWPRAHRFSTSSRQT
jgi:hypothetical protein